MQHVSSFYTAPFLRTLYDRKLLLKDGRNLKIAYIVVKYNWEGFIRLNAAILSNLVASNL